MMSKSKKKKTDEKLLSKISNRVKENRAAEKKKMKEMNFKEKLGYIWEYYKMHIISVVVVIIVIFSLLNTYVFNPAKKSYAGVAFLGYYIDDARLESLAGNLSEQLIDDPENFKVYPYSFIINTEDPEVNMAMIQRFMAMIASNELDILIIGTDDFEYMSGEGYYHDLTKIDGLDISKHEDKLLSGVLTETDETGQFGIDITGNKYFKDMGLNTDGKLIGIIANTKRLENSVAVLNYILSY